MGESANDVRRSWREYASRPDVVACLFGPYDSGKSSLLKRLLLDEGKPVPDWLTISGRRESFDVQESQAAGITIRDTPGIASNEATHDQRALEAILFCDVVLFVLPPKILTADREVVLGIASGDRFGLPSLVSYAPGSLFFVLSRIDEAGVSPLDDLDGYRELVKRKQVELGKIMASAAVTEIVYSVYPVAADPFGLVANEPSETRAAFDPYRDWDGIAPLTAGLSALPPRLAELRLRGECRFLGYFLQELANSCDQTKSQRLVAAEIAGNEASAHEATLERLRALLDAAKADLDKRVEEEIASAKRRAWADDSSVLSSLKDSLVSAVERWSDVHEADLDALLKEADAELSQRRSRPAWTGFAEHIGTRRSEPEPERPARNPDKIVSEAERILRFVQKAFREGQAAVTGMPVEKVREEVRKLNDAGSFTKYAQEARKGASRLSDPGNAARGAFIEKVDRYLTTAVPLVLELGRMVGDYVKERQEAERRAARRLDIGRRLEGQAREFADRVWTAWRDERVVVGVESKLKGMQEAAREIESDMRAEVARLGSQATEVRRTLKELAFGTPAVNGAQTTPERT
jgi:hypothetical protein